MRNHTDWQYVSVATLRALLADLPDDALVGPNTVSNLAVEGADGQWLGYIDLAQEGVMRWSEEAKPAPSTT